MDELVRQSFNTPLIIFKHSNRCSISAIAFQRLKPKLPAEFDLAEKFPCYFLDIFSSPDLSQEIAQRFKVHHESPQILLIKDGECVFESSHLDISLNEITDQIGLVTSI